MNGRKRTITVDTLGYLIRVFVHAANIYDGKAGIKLLKQVFLKFNISHIWADKTYQGEFVKYLEEIYNCTVEIKSSTSKGEFKPIKKRWIIERTFAFLTRNRRLAKEYERTSKSSESMVYIASSRFMLGKLKF